jgi:hypothetical protein
VVNVGVVVQLVRNCERAAASAVSKAIGTLFVPPAGVLVARARTKRGAVVGSTAIEILTWRRIARAFDAARSSARTVLAVLTPALFNATA